VSAAIIILAWGIALFNAGRALGATPPDWPAFALSACFVVGIPIVAVLFGDER